MATPAQTVLNIYKKSSLQFPYQKIIIKNQAFTLIELIVVMALMSILLFFSIPRLDVDIFSDENRDFSTWMLMTVKSLKENSQRENLPYNLFIDLDNNQIWQAKGIPLETKAKEIPEEIPKENEYEPPEGLQLIDVEFPDIEKKASGIIEIGFYPQGYSDKVIIHTEDNDNKRSSYVIESFLSQVKIYDRYIEF